MTMTPQQAVDRRLEIERSIVRHLVRELKAAGYEASQVYDGGEQVKTATETAVIETVFSVDDSTIHFDAGTNGSNAHGHGVLIVLGNGCDCISDYHCGDEAFTAIVDTVTEWTRKYEDECSRLSRAMR